MAKQAKNKRLDPLTLAYGVGAAIVIVGAMFKFLGWPLANEFFLVGLTTEALVFLISGFEFQKKAPERLMWERVFPQISPNFKGEYEQIDLSRAHEIYFRNTKALVESVENLGNNINKLNEATTKVAETAERLGDTLDRIDTASANYESELDDLSARMKQLNSFYDKMNIVAGKGAEEAKK